MSEKSSANIGFEKQIWDAAWSFGGISPQQSTERSLSV